MRGVVGLGAVVSSVLLTGARRGWCFFCAKPQLFDGKQGYVTRGFMLFGPQPVRRNSPGHHYIELVHF